MEKPNYISCHSLTPVQLKDIDALTFACQKEEGITLAFPAGLEDDNLPYPPYHLLYLGGKLVSALSLIPSADNTWEAMAMTLPAYRRRGFMDLLFDHAYDELCAGIDKDASDPDIAFYTDLKSESALQTLNALECDYWYSELMMSLEFPGKFNFEVRTDLSFSCVSSSDLTTYQAVYQDVVIGTCHILDFSLWYYLYGLEISPEYQNQGFGQAFLCHILNCLEQKDHKKVKLQVNSQNIPALALYQKTGFQEDDRIDYYLY